MSPHALFSKCSPTLTQSLVHSLTLLNHRALAGADRQTRAAPTGARPCYISHWIAWRTPHRLIIQILSLWMIDVHWTYTCVGILTDAGRKWFVPDTSVPAQAGQRTAAMETVSRVAGVQDKSVGIMTVILDLIAITRDTWLLAAY